MTPLVISTATQRGRIHSDALWTQHCSRLMLSDPCKPEPCSLITVNHYTWFLLPKHPQTLFQSSPKCTVNSGLAYPFTPFVNEDNSLFTSVIPGPEYLQVSNNRLVYAHKYTSTWKRINTENVQNRDRLSGDVGSSLSGYLALKAQHLNSRLNRD